LKAAFIPPNNDATLKFSVVSFNQDWPALFLVETLNDLPSSLAALLPYIQS